MEFEPRASGLRGSVLDHSATEVSIIIIYTYLSETFMFSRVGNASGQILINSQPQDVKQFRKLSRYIMQEDLLQPGITVLESMMIAAHLKLGNSQTKAQKLETVSTFNCVYSLDKE